MTLSQFSLGALVLLPLLAAAISAILPPTPRRIIGVGVAAGIAVLTIPVVLPIAGGTPVELAVGGYQAPLGITLRADGFSALFLILTAIVGALVSIYAALVPTETGQRLVAKTAELGEHQERRGLEWRAGHPAYWPLWLGCWAGLNAVFVSGDLFNTYVGLEVVGLTAVGLVALGGAEAWRAALRYLFVAVVGAMLFLVAVGLIVSGTGTLDIRQASEVIRDNPEVHPTVALALVLLTIGLAMKIALVPMHGWLIPAHSSAPGAVSPLLSALVIKASLFVLLRCWIWLVGPAVFGGQDSAGATSLHTVVEGLSWLLGGLGVLAIVLGSVLALRQNHLKPLVAYSTVAQAGYWFLFFPILIEPDSGLLEEEAVTTLVDGDVVAGALAGTVALVLGHGIAKAALFLVAAHLKHLYGTDELTELRGAGKRYPMLILAMGLSAVGLAGLPFSLAFSGKWELSTSAVASGQVWIVVAVVLATLLSAAYLARALGPLLLSESENPAQFDRLPKASFAAQAVPFTLGTLTVLTGFSGFWVTDILEAGAPW